MGIAWVWSVLRVQVAVSVLARLLAKMEFALVKWAQLAQQMLSVRVTHAVAGNALA
jgi:hypothetical protein